MSLFYPVRFEPVTKNIHGEYTITFRDFPEFESYGENLLDAIHKASDKLTEIVEKYESDGKELPVPSIRLDDELNITIRCDK